MKKKKTNRKAAQKVSAVKRYGQRRAASMKTQRKQGRKR